MIRPATAGDIPQLAALLTEDARQRSEIDPHLWRIDAEVPNHISKSLAAILSAQKELLFVAEQDQKLVAVSHALLVPPPPIYAPEATPGLLLDDCYTSPSAPSRTTEALLAASEDALRTMGATSFIASCSLKGPWYPIYTDNGYEHVTLYLTKDLLPRGDDASNVRAATADDIPSIVRLSADHRKTLQELNPRFWRIHPKADQRFEAWMRFSLTLPDRDMLVAEQNSAITGYIIAQPCPRLHIPAAHDITKVSTIDDFYATDFAEIENTTSTSSLIAAAESALIKRDYDTALMICPARWTSKRKLLERAGYAPAKIWMLKKE